MGSDWCKIFLIGFDVAVDDGWGVYAILSHCNGSSR